jgi:hypothetical protein
LNVIIQAKPMVVDENEGDKYFYLKIFSGVDFLN